MAFFKETFGTDKGGNIYHVPKTPKSQALHKMGKKEIPKHYRGNTNSEGGIAFGKAPKGER